MVVLIRKLPMPTRISFQGNGIGEPGTAIMCLTLGTVADGQAWSRHLGGRTDSYISRDGRIFLDEGLIKWHGWSVQLHASDDPSTESWLDATMTANLIAVAKGDAQ